MDNNQSGGQQLPSQDAAPIMGNNQGSDQQPLSLDTPPTSDIFSQFASMLKVANTLPADLVPCRHSDLILDDPSVSWPQWNTIFGKDLKLTKMLCSLYPQIERKRSKDTRKYYGLRLADADLS